MSIFRITFQGNLNGKTKDEILDILIINLKDTYYKKIERIENSKLIIEGELFPSRLWINNYFNLWSGFSKKTEIYFTAPNIINYSIDYAYAIYFRIIIILMVFLFFLSTNISILSNPIILYFLSFCITGLIITLIIAILRHRSLFYYSLKVGSKYKGKYDWNSILKSKSIKELKNIANGNIILTEEVQELAKKELFNRQQTIKTGK